MIIEQINCSNLNKWLGVTMSTLSCTSALSVCNGWCLS